MNTRFHVGSHDDAVVVIDVTVKAYNALSNEERRKHRIVEFHVGGMVSHTLAGTWAEQIAAQLNQFDAANAAVAKLQ